MYFNDALEMLADVVGISWETMKGYGAERPDITGWSGDGLNTDWPIGSMWADEGHILYALIRALRPLVVVEMGIHHGCSSKHILAAMVKNKRGKLHSVDIALRDDYDVTVAERKRWEIQSGTAQAANYPKNADIVFEDLMHDFEGTRQALKIAKKLKAPFVISHDGEHDGVGQNIRDAFVDVYGTYNSFITEGCDCGFAYWKES